MTGPINFGQCGHCQRFRDRIRNRGEDICEPCMDAEMKITGINILVVPWQPGRAPWVYNTVRDADKVYPCNAVGTKYEVGDGRDMPGVRRAKRAARKKVPQ